MHGKRESCVGRLEILMDKSLGVARAEYREVEERV